MTIDESRRHIWEAMQRARERRSIEPELPLRGGDGGGTSGGMEARLAKLEASMDYVKADLARLAGLPAETARIAERTGHTEAAVDRLIGLPAEVARLTERAKHLPTTADMQMAIETAVDRASARTQRAIAIVGGLVTIAVAIITSAPKLIAAL